MPVLSASDSLDVGLALSNPVLESASATLIARDYSGTLIQGPGITNPKTLLLPPQSQIALLASEIFGAGISTGWVEVQLSSPDVQGFFLLFDSRISFMDGAALSSVPTNRLIFPKVTSNPSTANWLTLINTGDQAINRVAISLFENSGRLVAQGYFPLQPRAVLSGRITDLFVNLGPFDGYAVAEATALPVRKVLVGLETYQYRGQRWRKAGRRPRF